MLSVIVPVYNTAAYLSQCVASLLSQSFQDMEIVLVNDGSTDSSPKLCDDFAGRYKNIKVIHKENGGLISAWIAGTEAASGEFVGYVDSDDYVLEDYFQVLMQPVIEHNCDISMCGFTRMNAKREVAHPAHKDINGLYTGDKLEYIKHNYYNNVNIHNSRCVKVLRKSLVMKNIDQLDRRITLAEDMTITVPCVLDATSIYVNNSYLGYCYRVTEQSMTNQFNPKLIQNYQRLYNNIIPAFEKRAYMNDYVYDGLLEEYITVVGSIVFSDNSIRERVAFLNEFRRADCASVLLARSYNSIFPSNKILKILMQFYAFRTMCLLVDIKKRLRKETL